MTLSNEVTTELNELAKLGVTVPAGAFERAKGDLSDYDNMKVSELADLLILLG